MCLCSTSVANHHTLDTFRIETKRAGDRGPVAARAPLTVTPTSLHMRLLLRHARRQRGEKIVDRKIIRAPCRPERGVVRGKLHKRQARNGEEEGGANFYGGLFAR